MNQPENNPLFKMMTDLNQAMSSVSAGMEYIKQHATPEQQAEINQKIANEMNKASKEISNLAEQLKNI